MAKISGSFDMELFFRALADRTRLRLLSLMTLDETCVCFLVSVIAPNQPKISRSCAEPGL
jgi:DNA-binding transcriptional ArsR family regulator